ncbi:unnamed protein product [Schistosoma turkestanicum]|nr:unnamed protein product [Schistosoma turkestanicum]
MDRDTMLENFLACTGLTDITYGISVLEDHNWDLTAAVSSIIGDEFPASSPPAQEDQSLPYSTVFPMPPFIGPIFSSEASTDRNPATQSVSVSTMCGFDTDFSGSDTSSAISRSVIELDSDQATFNSCRQVRILNFEIDLELPIGDDMNHEKKFVKESFPFPDTETVGFLKQHFIDCRLTELIQLATSPEFETKITEYSKANLMKHLVLESSGSHSFDDNSALLRTLHLPKCIKLRAKLIADPLPQCDNSNQQNELVTLHISLCETPTRTTTTTTTATTTTRRSGSSSSSIDRPEKSTSPSTTTYHDLHLPCDALISQIHQDLQQITGIPITNQFWSSIQSKANRRVHSRTDDVPIHTNKQIVSNKVLNLLIHELNQPYFQQQQQPQQHSNRQSFKNKSTASIKHSNVPATMIHTTTTNHNVCVDTKHKSSHNNCLTLADCGLKSGDICYLYLTASNPLNQHKNSSKTQLSNINIDDGDNDDGIHSELVQQQPTKKSSQSPLDDDGDNVPSGSLITSTNKTATDVFPTDTFTKNKSNRKTASNSKKRSCRRNLSPEIGFDDEYDNDNDEDVEIVEQQPEQQAEEDEEDEDYDMDDYHYSSDEMLVETDDKKITPWNQPLIPDDLSIADPELATQQFCIVFLQRYCSDGVTMSPPFSTCSLDTALSLTVGTSQVCERKPLFIYLHNDTSVACHVFCQQVLCSSGLFRFLTDHEFSLWPWDVTRTRAKERLLGWLEVKLPNLSRIITPLSVDSYPVLAMIVKLSGQLEVLCLVMGTGIVKIWPPIDHFPSLFNVHNNSSSSTSGGGRFTAATMTTTPSAQSMKDDGDSSAVTSSSGSLKPDVIVAELWQAYTTYLELLEPECVTEREILARRRVLEEQEAAYEESLRRDQEKEWERAKAKAEEEKRKQLEEEKRINDELLAEQHRLSMAASLPPEPPVPKTPAAEAFLSTPDGVDGIATLRFRLPPSSQCSADSNRTQSTMIRRFAGSNALKYVFIFMESKGFPKSDYKLITTYPIRDLTLLDENMTLAKLGLVPQETLTLELR